MPRDYYEVLEVDRHATAEDIRKAHRRLARKFHPDMNKSTDAATRFAEIQEAYDVLSDASKRQSYDRFGHAGVSAGAGGPGGAGGRGGGPAGAAGTWSGHGGRPVSEGHVDPAEFASIFEEFFGGGGRQASPFDVGGFGVRGAPGTRAATRARPGRDIEHPLHVTFLTAALGGHETVRLGHADGADQQIDVKIPAGVNSGAKLRVRGKGEPGPRGSPPGDLILTVEVGKHPWFRREGLDILMDLPITIAEAALGATVRAPLLKGSVELKVPPGTGSGQRLRVKSRGIVDAKGQAGDFLAVIQVAAPRGLTAQDQATLKDLGSRLQNPRESAPWADLT